MNSHATGSNATGINATGIPATGINGGFTIASTRRADAAAKHVW
jgi:hypothetical protein